MPNFRRCDVLLNHIDFDRLPDPRLFKKVGIWPLAKSQNLCGRVVRISSKLLKVYSKKLLSIF